MIDPLARDASRLSQTIGDVATRHRLLAESVGRAWPVQWEQAPTDRTHESEARRSPGAAPADPTADAALDARRLRLRRALRDSDVLLRVLDRALRDACREVDEALGPWDGETSA